MRTLRLIFRTLLPALLIMALASGCTVQARKARHLARGEKYFKAGEYEKAKLEYLNVMRIDPQGATAYERMGAIWLEQGAPLRAGPFLTRAREIAPRDVANRLSLARLYLSVGALAEGRNEVLAILQLTPDNPDAARLLVETSRSPDELAAAGQVLQKFSDKNTVAFQLAVATLALKKGDIAGGETSLKAALQLDPKAASAHTALGAIELMRRNVEKAGEELKAAADASPLRSIERIQYAEFKAQTGGAKEAIASLKAILAQAPDYLPAWRLLGQIAFAEKRYDDSLAALENVFKTDPDNVDARMVQADVLVAKGEGAKAVEVLQRLEKTFPKVPAIKIQLARASLLSNNAADATAALNDALALEPENVEAKVLLAETNLRAGDAQAVVKGLADLVSKHPGVGQAQMLLADAYRLLGRFEDAAALFRNQLKTSPESAPVHLGLGVILREEKKNEEARAAFEKALELSPANLIAINQLVEMDIADKAYDTAMTRIRTLQAAAPQQAPGYVLEGKVDAAQQQWGPAETALSKAIELDPNFGPAYDLLISSYLADNKLAEAATRLEGLAAKNPTNTAALMQLGLTYEKLNDFAKAAGNYEKVVALKPDFAAAWNNLAYLYSEKLNQLDKALDAGRRARSLQPGDGAIADTLGWILYRQGDYQQALNLLQDSAGKLGDNAEVQFHLGSAAYMMGQADVARTALRKAAEAGKDFPGKDEAERRLALLGDSSGSGREMSIGDLEALVKQHPHDLLALTRLAEAYEKQGKFPQAAGAYDEALKINPKLVPPTVKLAQLYAGPLKNTAKALDLAKKARELAPNDATVSAVIGALAFKSGNFPWSYSLLQEAIRKKPDDPEVLRDYSWAAYSVGKVPEAQQSMERLVASAPNSPEASEAKTFLAIVALGQHPDDPARSESQIEALLKEQPGYVPALFAKAMADFTRGQMAQAKDGCRAVLRTFPDFAPAQKQLARLYADESGDLAEAYDLAMKARQVMPADVDLAWTLGEISYKRKEYARAVQFLQESGRGKPLDAQGLFFLGMSLVQTGQKSPARDVLERAIASGLKKPMADEAQQALSDLGKKA